ncbi:HypC/HybG/HupF family hydrogenase formation chaperone [Streptomyces odontomachi]|uniref:HypC/HybG/HupF family hydrogenase formation chaperone n=1 Tax=Streptomyces odontomachi TaxID=2944940 RepID=UPI00210B9C08|nr:HypC/HybG/HupF family hydrogenase formation chaperone [Streptomyces sp. ODS25]
MCLAVPGKVVATQERDGIPMAKVDFGGVVKDVCLAYLPDIEIGDWTIVHVGFALQRLDEESALATLELFGRIGALEEEFGDAWQRAAAEAGAELPPGIPPQPPAAPVPDTPSPEAVGPPSADRAPRTTTGEQ